MTNAHAAISNWSWHQVRAECSKGGRLQVKVIHTSRVNFAEPAGVWEETIAVNDIPMQIRASLEKAGLPAGLRWARGRGRSSTIRGKKRRADTENVSIGGRHARTSGRGFSSLLPSDHGSRNTSAPRTRRGRGFRCTTRCRRTAAKAASGATSHGRPARFHR